MGVYAASDFHGYWNIAQQIIDFLKPDDTLYYLGDACDRGKDGIKILNWLFKDDRVKFIKGNHEQFLMDGLQSNLRGERYSLWLDYNGGTPTLNGLKKYQYKNHLNKKALFRHYICKIKNLPIELIYTSPNGHSVILDHSGYTPFKDKQQPAPLWNRNHFYDEWGDGQIKRDETILDAKNTFLVHGHSPSIVLRYKFFNEGPQNELNAFFRDDFKNCNAKFFKYCNNHKIDIDCGTFFTHMGGLLNLDTFEELYFYDY